MTYRYLLLSIVFVLSGCIEHKVIITNGSYGPFTIGDSKQKTFDIVNDTVGMAAIEPLPVKEIKIENPSIEEMVALDDSNGILVWLDNQPFPMRIVINQNRFVRTWGVSDKCRASVERMNVACKAIQELGEHINTAKTRNDVYRLIYEFDTNLSKTLGSFVVGYQQFRIGRDRTSNEYKMLLIDNDAWRFNGMRHLSKYSDPFYSRITLYFQDEKLLKIEHWSFPYELP